MIELLFGAKITGIRFVGISLPNVCDTMEEPNVEPESPSAKS